MKAVQGVANPTLQPRLLQFFAFAPTESPIVAPNHAPPGQRIRERHVKADQAQDALPEGI